MARRSLLFRIFCITVLFVTVPLLAPFQVIPSSGKGQDERSCLLPPRDFFVHNVRESQASALELKEGAEDLLERGRERNGCPERVFWEVNARLEGGRNGIEEILSNSVRVAMKDDFPAGGQLLTLPSEELDFLVELLLPFFSSKEEEKEDGGRERDDKLEGCSQYLLKRESRELLLELRRIREGDLPLLEAVFQELEEAVQEGKGRIQQDYFVIAINLFNALSPVKNLERFKRTEGQDFIPVSVRVSSRIEPLEIALEFYERIAGIENALLIFSHSNLDRRLFTLLDTPTFCATKQLIHPYAGFLHGNTFPGNISHSYYIPDHYGNNRPFPITNIKHHIWWLWNYLWEILTPQRYKGFAYFVEDDVWLAPDVFQLTEKLRGSPFVDEDVLAISFAGNVNIVGVEMTEERFFNPDRLNKFVFLARTNIAFAMSRDAWQRLSHSKRNFCKHDEMHWDSTIEALQTCHFIPGKVLAPDYARAIHVGFSGMNWKAAPRRPLRIIQQEFLEYGKRGQMWTLSTEGFQEVPFEPKICNPNHPGYGGWNHPFDKNLCLAMQITPSHDDFPSTLETLFEMSVLPFLQKYQHDFSKMFTFSCSPLENLWKGQTVSLSGITPGSYLQIHLQTLSAIAMVAIGFEEEREIFGHLEIGASAEEKQSCVVPREIVTKEENKFVADFSKLRLLEEQRRACFDLDGLEAVRTSRILFVFDEGPERIKINFFSAAVRSLLAPPKTQERT